MATFYSLGPGCADAGSWLHPTRPAHSSPHSGLHPYHDWRVTISINRLESISLSLAYGAPRPDRHCGIGRTGTHHCLMCHILCLLSHSRRRRLCSKVSLGHLVRTYIPLPNWRIICIHRKGAKMKRFILTIRSSWRSSRGVEIFIQPPRFLWCGRPVSRLRRKILLMHPWDTPSILATSCWELPSADNLTIRCSICSCKFCGMIPIKISKKYQ